MQIVTGLGSRAVPGLALTGAGALLCLLLERLPLLQAWSLGALTLAIGLGMVLGHVPWLQGAGATRWAAGVQLAKGPVLRAGIVLYGLRLSVQDITALGWGAVALDVFILSSTVALAWALGRYVLKLEPRSALLIGAGSAICGAAAVLATAPVAQARERDVGVAVATVVVFGTLSMFLYPWLAGVLWPATAYSSPGYGVYVGATVHEVAQVVVAASAIGGQAAHTAVITKMLRVLLLAPFLLILSWWLGRGAPADGGRGRITIPWFALGFVAVVLLHPGLPQPLVRLGVWLDQWLLTIAMLALGMGIQWQALRRAGIRPLWLAGALWLWLLGAGAVLTRWGWPG